MIRIWIENYLLPCPFKALTGFDCPGCGFQRSVVALLQGRLADSFHFYPATVPILLLAVFLLLKMKFSLDQKGTFSRALTIMAAVTVIVSYVFKLKSYL